MAAEPDSSGTYRGGIFDQIDVPALVSLVLSFLGFLMLVLWLRPKQEEATEPEPQLEALSERMARILMPLKLNGPAPKAKPPPPRPKPASTEQARSALARIERSRKSLNTHIQEVEQRVSRTAVLSILSSKRAGGLGSKRRGSGSASLGFGDLDRRLSSLDGITRYEERGSGDVGRDDAVSKVDADPLIDKFATARKSSAAKIGTLEFERPKLLSGANQAGGRRLQVLSTFISRNQTSIRLLYEERLKLDPSLEGKVTVVMTIEEDGRVSSARIVPEETTFSDTELQEEIRRCILRWVFPAFKGGAVELKSPFVFKPL